MSASYSVIIPTRDRPQMLARALASVFSQTAPAQEILVVDNSGDPSVAQGIVLTGNPNCRLIHSPDAPNAASVRNVGLKAANSQYVAFLDDDDEWLPGKMAEQLDYLRAHPDCSAVSCGRYIVSSGGIRSEVPCEETIDRFLPYDNFGGSFSFLVLNRERCANLMLDEKLIAFQDWDFLLRARRCGRVGVVPSEMARYHDHLAPRITNALLGRRRALQRILLVHRNWLPRDARRWILSRICALRARERISAGVSRWRVVGDIARSLQWGLRCRLPLWLKVRGLGGRLLVLLPDTGARFTQEWMRKIQKGVRRVIPTKFKV